MDSLPHQTVNMDLFVAVAVLLASAAGTPTQSPQDSCYPLVGCFSNAAPWTSPTRGAPPPQHPLNVTTSMILYTPSDMVAGMVIPIFPEINVAGMLIDKDKPTFVIFHGYGANSSSPWVLSVKDSLIRRTGGNVLVLAWGMTEVEYEQAASNARVAGKLVAMAIEKTQLNPSNMHFIAHCIGSHIASYAAKLLMSSGDRINRLTALNPAAPLFEGQPAEVRLDVEDADFVDILHTEVNYTGMAKPAGHADFYFNSGTRQPGCDVPTVTKTYATCSHSIAEKYYAEAVESDCMMGQPGEVVEVSGSVEVRTKEIKGADSAGSVSVGLSTPQTTRGVYVVRTNPQAPYCISDVAA